MNAKDRLIFAKYPLLNQKYPLLNSKSPLRKTSRHLLNAKDPLLNPRNRWINDKNPLVNLVYRTGKWCCRGTTTSVLFWYAWPVIYSAMQQSRSDLIKEI